MSNPSATSALLDQEQLSNLWSEACLALENTVSPFLVSAWGKTSRLHRIEDFDDSKWLATFACPSAFNALQFEKNLKDATVTVLTQKLGRPVELKFIFNILPASDDQSPDPALSPASPPSSSDTTPPPASPGSSPTPIPAFRDGSLFAPATVHSTLVSRASAIAKNLGLRPDFTFDTFAVSSSNEMAHAVAESVAKNPGLSYNPLFLYGSVGVGKTHLVQAIGNYIISHNPEATIVYCTSEYFINSIITGIHNKSGPGFKEKWRTCDVLLMDDIQLIAKTEKVQEEFFHTFNALVAQNRQIVLTSDRPPHEIPLLADRIRSRFEAGFVTDIQQPSFELRTAILLTKAQAAHVTLPMSFAQTIASRVDSARELEGVIQQIKGATEIRHLPLDQNLIDNILARYKQKTYSHRLLSPKEIIATVAHHFHLKPAIVTGTRRQKEIIRARHIAMFLIKSFLCLSYSEVGALFSHRDHTSVIHAVSKINTDSTTDPLLADDLAAIRSTLLGN